MGARTVFESPNLAVQDYCCDLGPHDPSFWEVHRGFSVAFVRTFHRAAFAGRPVEIARFSRIGSGHSP